MGITGTEDPDKCAPRSVKRADLSISIQFALRKMLDGVPSLCRNAVIHHLFAICGRHSLNCSVHLRYGLTRRSPRYADDHVQVILVNVETKWTSEELNWLELNSLGPSGSGSSSRRRNRIQAR
jgi:hypothetical protein